MHCGPLHTEREREEDIEIEIKGEKKRQREKGRNRENKRYRQREHKVIEPVGAVAHASNAFEQPQTRLGPWL